MIAGRLRECLKILRWEAGDLAAELGHPRGEIAAWLDGRSPAYPAAQFSVQRIHSHSALPDQGRPRVVYVRADRSAGEREPLGPQASARKATSPMPQIRCRWAAISTSGCSRAT